MVITDIVYGEIKSQLALYAPERGGALYGIKGYPFVTHFEYDPEGETSPVSYVPSTRLIDNVPKVEAETGLQFKGIIHSHPIGYSRPSRGDEQTVASFFRLNPHISAMELPIVQQVISRGFGGDSEFLHWYRAERRGKPVTRTYGFGTINCFHAAQSNHVEVIPEDFHIVPIKEHVKRVITLLRERELILSATQRVQPLKVQNAELVGLVATSLQGHEFMFFVSLDYPIVAPVVLYQRNGKTENLRFRWDGMSNVDGSLSQIAELLFDEWHYPKSLGSRLADGISIHQNLLRSSSWPLLI